MSREKNYSASNRQVDLGGNLVPLAEDVAVQRATLVGETFFHLAAIRSLQFAPATGVAAIVQCVAARVQDTSAQNQQQAAHLLPGTLLVAGVPVWELAKVPAGSTVAADEVQRLGLQTKVCFSKTNVLPAEFNRADSQAEAKVGGAGLKGLFAETARRLWSTARVVPTQPLYIDRSATLTALKSWFDAIGGIYEAAADAKLVAAGNEGGASSRELQAAVLRAYARSFKIANVARFAHSAFPQVATRYRWL